MIGLIGTAAAENQEFWPVRNDSGEEIPSFACMRITGMFAPWNIEDGSGGIFRVGVANMGFTVAKPNSYGSQGFHMFNGPMAIASGTVGQGTFGTVMMARYSGGIPSIGSTIGPINGSWYVNGTGAGFRVLDLLLSETDGGTIPNVRVVSDPARVLRGSITSAGVMTIASTSETITVTYGGAVGDTVFAHWIGGAWYAIKG